MGLRRTLVFVLSALGRHQRHDVTCLVLGMGLDGEQIKAGR